MLTEGPRFLSARQLMQSVNESAAAGQKRDCISDMEDFLRLEKIRWQAIFKQEEIPDKPTIFAANHFRRYRIDRLRPLVSAFSNTRESAITTSLISVEAVKLTPRKMSWLVEDGIREEVLSFRLPEASTQKAVVKCYDWIPVPKIKSGLRGFSQELRDTLTSGKNIGIYPEGKTNYKMREFDPAFAGLLKRLQKAGVDFQIVPVTVFYTVISSAGSFHVTFHEAVDSRGKGASPSQLAQETMFKIGSSLPYFAKSKSL